MKPRLPPGSLVLLAAASLGLALLLRPEPGRAHRRAPPRRTVPPPGHGLGPPRSYGGDVKTPNLDRLAARGRRFDGAYGQYPESGPSRASLLSGWRPETTLVWRDKDSLRVHGKALAPLQKQFRAGGYFVARV